MPAIVSYIGGPDRGNVDPAVVATNIMLTLLVLFLFGLTAEIFNSTMDANRDEVHGWWARLFRGPLALLAALNFSGTSLGHLSGSGRIGSTARVLLDPQPARHHLRLPEPRLRLEPAEPHPHRVAHRRASAS